MVDWIEPLKLETWFINVFAGSSDIFLAFALFFIFGMSAYFGMSGLLMFFMLAMFLVIFSSYITSYLLVMIGVFGGLLAGVWVSKLVKN
jgi:hypothetical protein